uniref:Fibrinogen C-terminal domain-containing protein n=1 Tax=Anopheles merus TaxID=30066 RepID=A0A182V4I1_ANOME
MFSAQLDYLQNKLLEVDATVQGIGEKIGHNLTTLQEQSSRMLAQQTAYYPPVVYSRTIVQGSVAKDIGPRYLIQPFENETAFDGYCEQSRFGGGWLVMQPRYDGLLNFQRGWSEYVNGFGSVVGEFWLGLERVHRLTVARSHELMVELEDFAGNYVHARYGQFEIGSGKDQ